MSGGTITRKDLITDEGLEFGKEYAKNIRLAIEANDDLVDSAKALAQIANSYQKANNSQAFITAKNEEKLALQKVENAIKAEELALKSAEKIKQESLRTRKLELDAINKEETAKKRSTKLTIEERVQNEINNRALKQATLEKLGLVSAYDKLNKSRTEAKNKLRDLIVTEGESSKATIKARQEFEKLDAQVKKADRAVGDFTKNVGNYPSLKSFASGVKDIAGAFGLAAGTAAFASVMQGAVQIIKEFEQSVADLQAITGASGADLEFLKKSAIDMGKGVKGGAVAVVESYKLIASAKPELLENVKDLNAVTEAVITLSKASGMELPAAATALTDAMNQFGAPAEEAAFFVDALANGAKYGAAEIPDVTDALLKFGAVAKTSNINIKESTALIELLAEKGLKGAEAGTALRNVLLKISAPEALPKDAQRELAKLGISMETLKDKTIPVQQRLEALKPILNDQAAAVRVFGIENVVAAKNIIGHTDRLKELTAKMGEFGTAEEQATIRSQTLQGKTDKLASTYDSLILSLANGKGPVSEFFSFFVEGASGALESIIRLNKGWDELYSEAKLEGIKKGAKEFQREFNGIFTPGISDEKEVIEGIKVRAENLLNEYKKQYNKNKKELAEFNPYALNFFGPSGKDLTLEKEALTKKIAQQQSIIDEAKKKFANVGKANKSTEVENEEEISKLTAEEIKKRQDAAIKARKEYLSTMKKLDDDSFALAKFRMDQEIEISNEIANNESESIQDRIDAYLNAQQVEVSLAQETAAHKLRAISQYSDDVRDLTNEEINTLINGGQIKKKLTDDEILVIEEYQAKKDNLDKKDLANRQKIIDSIVAIEQKKTDKVLQNQDTELNKRLEAENKLYAENLELLKGNQAEIEALTLLHEEEVFNIKKEYAKKALTEQINALQTLLDAEAKKPEAERISADKIADIQNKISKYRVQLSEEDLKNTQLVANKRVELEKEAADLIKELQSELTSTMKDLVFALFDAKIQSIDADIQANDEYYAQQLEMAEGDATQKALIEQERDKKRKALEKERRKEEFKAALAQRILATAQIGIDLAKTLTAINLAAAQLDAITFGTGGTPYRAIQIPLAIGLSAAQTALVLASPLPKYEEGTQGKPHKGGKALVGEVRPEVILEPGKNPYVVSKPTILDLKRGTEVIPSIDEYQQMKRASILASLDMEGKKAKNYQGADAFNARYDAELLEELRRNTEATKKNKSNVVVQNNIDLGHEIWKLSNIKWNA
jgi:TP901 family phage tail tape measure protein